MIPGPSRRWSPAAPIRVVLPVALSAALSAGSGCKKDRADPLPPDAPVPAVEARTFATGAIALDGVLDESAWDRTDKTEPFVDPGRGRKRPGSAVQARARLGWDEQRLYVAVVVEERDPSSPFSPDDVDPHIWERASAIELMIQPGDPGDNRDYYEIQVDVAGAVWDTRFDDYNQPITGQGGRKRFGHQDWTSGVVAGIDVRPDDYVVELAVPWSALASERTPVPPEDGDTWRINLYSFRNGQRDALAWSPLLGQGNFHYAPRFGRVTFRRAAGKPAD